MNKLKNNITMLNIVASLTLNIATIVGGFIIPKLIISGLGSEVNGLYLSLEQYLNYFSLMEGGLGGVVTASLYKPLVNNDIDKVSRIIVTVTKFFRKIALLFIIYLMGVAVLYPIIVKSSFSYIYIFSLTLVLGINFFVRYYAMLICRILLHADRKVYVTAIVQTLCLILEIAGFIIAIRIHPNIHIIKLVTVAAYIVQLLLLERYVKKNYPIDYNAKPDLNLISQRWDGMGIMTAAFIHHNTDIVVLTLVSTLRLVSVYSVYSMIVNAIRSLISSVVSGVTPSIGALIAKGHIDDLRAAYNSYEFFMTYIVFVIYSCCAVLITPFVAIYTFGVEDINYIEPIFGLLITLAQMSYCLREPTSTLLYAANKYKEISPYAYVEAALNIVVSIAFVYSFGLVGVAIGTVSSIAIRHILQLYYLSKNIINRSMLYSLKLFSIFGVGFVIVNMMSRIYMFKIETNYISWVMYGFITFTISFCVFTTIAFCFYRNEMAKIIKFVIKSR